MSIISTAHQELVFVLFQNKHFLLSSNALIDYSWRLQFVKQTVYWELSHVSWDVVIQFFNWYNFSSKERTRVLCYTFVFNMSICEHTRCFLFHTHTYIIVENWHYLLRIISCPFVKKNTRVQMCVTDSYRLNLLAKRIAWYVSHQFF